MDNSQIVFENGTMLGAVNEVVAVSSPIAKYQVSSHSLNAPEIVINSSYSCNSLNQSQHRCDMSIANNCSSASSNVNRISNRSVNVIEEVGEANADDSAAESTALLEKCQKKDGATNTTITTAAANDDDDDEDDDDEEGHFEQFVMNRTISDSNMLESSVYSELQFQPSIEVSVVADKGSRNGDRNGVSTGESDGGIVPCSTNNSQTPPLDSATPTSTEIEAATVGNATNSVVVDMLNTSACSRSESRQSKRMRRKPYKLRNCSNSSTASANAQRTTPVGSNGYLHTAIFVNHSHHHLHPHAHHHGASTNALSQLGSAAPANPNYLQQLQQPAGMLPQPPPNFSNNLRRSFIFDSSSTVHSNAADDERNSGARNNQRLSCFRSISFKKWFSRPSLPFVIGILALGGVACTLGGIVLGSTGLIEHSTHYLSASLLMVGIGVSLLVISGAIWKLSLPDEGSDCPCFRHMEACRSCNSPFCANRLMAANYYYPEFQHRRPPPTYMDSLHQTTDGFFMTPFGQLYRSPYGPGAAGIAAAAAAAAAANAAAAAGYNRPPPLYRSTVSLNAQMPPHETAITANVHVPPMIRPSPMVLPPPLFGPPPMFEPTTIPEININPPAFIHKEVNYLELD